MSPMTMRGLSLAAVVAVWTAISEMARVPLSLWPVIVALGCSLAAGGGIPGLQRTLAGTISGVVWAIVAHAVSRALGGQDLVLALVLGGAAFAASTSLRSASSAVSLLALTVISRFTSPAYSCQILT